MNTRSWILKLCIFLLVVALASCGGDTQVAGGGTGGTGKQVTTLAGLITSDGSITSLGATIMVTDPGSVTTSTSVPTSLWVNGIEFDITAAQIQRDGVAAPASDLRPGMSVEITGSAFGSVTDGFTGIADTVEIQAGIRGQVESIAGTANAATLVVLGQVVYIDDTTLFESKLVDFASIAAADLLEIHGNRDPKGRVTARYVERKLTPAPYALRGQIANHNATTHTFTIGALNIDYTNAARATNLPPLTLSGNNWNGLYVDLRGNTCASTLECGTLTASQIKSTGVLVNDTPAVALEGNVTSLASASASDFTIEYQRVITNNSTVYIGGVAADIVLDAKIQVEGDRNGQFISANVIRFVDTVLLQSNAVVSGTSITLEGLPGITVSTNRFTDLSSTRGASASSLTPLNGRSVRIRGRTTGSATGSNTVMATRIEDRGVANPSGAVTLMSEVFGVDVANPSLSILGVSVDTTRLIGSTDFLDVLGAPMNPLDLFNSLTTNGGVVTVLGKLPGNAGNAMSAGFLKSIQLGK